MSMGEMSDEVGEGSDWSVARQVMVIGILGLMIVALGAVALKGGSSRADTSDEATAPSAAGAVAKGPITPVPSVVGKSQSDAIATLRQAGFNATVTVSRPDNHVPKGQIANQLPAAGAKAHQGTTVQLALSLGVEDTVVPRLVGYPADGALTLLQRAGLGYVATTEVSEKPVGQVLRQSPAAGATRPKGTKVALIVSSGTSWLLPGESIPGLPPGTDGTWTSYWIPQGSPVGTNLGTGSTGGTSSNPNTPMGGPGTTRPPATHAPTTRPPSTQPPATYPPATYPPVTYPPPTYPPPTTGTCYVFGDPDTPADYDGHPC